MDNINDNQNEKLTNRDEIIEIQQINPEIKKSNLNEPNLNHLFLFINPISGSQEGKIILSLFENFGTKEDNTYQLELRNKSHSYAFNIIDPLSFTSGINLLKAKINEIKNFEELKNKEIITETENILNSLKLRVLIGGGDGTVLSVIEHFDKIGVDVEKCYFGHIPIGTGNDLSNTLGFGSTISINSNNLLKFENILFEYQMANSVPVDVWQMKLVVDDV
jgi:hypothetical protein